LSEYRSDLQDQRILPFPTPRMHLLIFLFAALVASNPTHHRRDLLPRGRIAYPGPIPYPNPAFERPNPQDVVANDKHLGLSTDTQTLQTMKDCLVAYGSDRFFDSWDGNICGGMGWFKGSHNGNIDPYGCYEVCASYVEGDGFTRGVKDFQCDFRKGTKGHCWMGYHPLPPSSTPISSITLPTHTPSLDVETAG